MAYPFPAFDFTQILLWTESFVPERTEDPLSEDEELVRLGLLSVVDLAPSSRMRGMWALNFVRSLSAVDLDAAIRRIRRLMEETKRKIKEVGPTPRRYFQMGPTLESPLPFSPSFSLGARAAWTADQSRPCLTKSAARITACGAELLRKRAWAAYYPGWQVEAAGVPLTLGDQSIEIVVLDSGADVYHPALGGWILPFSSTPLEDIAGHGSHVVSTICGQAWGTPPSAAMQLADDYEVDFIPSGVLPKNPIRLGNVAKADPVVGDEGASAFEVDWILYIQALNDLVTPGSANARLLNLSLGGPEPSLLEQNILAQIAKAKSLVVAAAGNHRLGDSFTRVLYPAGYPECISVGASSRDLNQVNSFPYVPWDRSNDGLTDERISVGRSAVDVYAPGRNIVGAMPVSLLNQSRPFGFKSGTSMATAFATGIFGVRLSRVPATLKPFYEDAVTACNDKLPDLANRGGHMVAVANFIGP